MMRRGFTMLEVAMASALGAILVLACVAVFFTIDRTDGLLSRRAQQAADLQRLRLVVQRATSTLVMSNAPQTQQTDTARAGARGLELPANSVSVPAPRLIVDRDPLMGRYAMTSNGGGQWRPDQTFVQRYEVVLTDPPVPSEGWDLFSRAGVRSAASPRREPTTSRFQDGSKFSNEGESKFSDKGNQSQRGVNRLDNAAQPAEGDDAAMAPVRAIRGALELRPQAIDARERRRIADQGDDAPMAWEMWWVPLPPRESVNSPEPTFEDLAAVGEPYLVASNLRYVKWTVFHERQRKSAHSSTWHGQMPAYIELAVETTAGLTANWMFELDWSRGPEVPPRPTAPAGPIRAQPVNEAGGAQQPAATQPRRPVPARPNQPVSRPRPQAPPAQSGGK
jgi:prepilin-type N-terminal cleavage/methylation domain-containing protein